MKRYVVALALIVTATAAIAQQPEPYTAAVVMEPTTGRVLYEKNARQPFPTASMTKMMTLLIVVEQIRDGQLRWDTPVRTSARASKMGGSQVYLKEGETFPVRDMVAATMVHSANDAAMALAEHVGGSAEGFVRLMNDRAKRLGLQQTRYYSPHGLPDESNQDDVMSPMDLAKLGVEVMKFPELRQLATIQQMPFRGGAFTMYNPNHLLKNYPGATGIKTGYHGKAGFCVTGSARRGNMDLVVVVMGSKQKRDNFQSAGNLLSEAFATWRMREVVRKGARIPQHAAIEGGETATVPVMAASTATVLTRSGDTAKIQTTVASTRAQAPIRKGQQVGWVVVKQNGKPVAKVPALASVSVEQESWFKRLFGRLWPF